MRCLVWLMMVWFAICPARPAGAGAWMRDEGTGFLSTGAILRQGDPQAARELSLYGDYGLSPRLTLGVDVNQRPGVSGHALLFARLPLNAPEARSKFALETALGGHHWMGDWSPMYRVTFSAGRGFTTRKGAHGWIALDASYERRLGDTDPAYKLDGTIGLSGPARLRPILQIETAFSPGQPVFWAVTPGLLIEGGHNRTWHLGLERKSASRDTLGLKLGLWLQF